MVATIKKELGPLIIIVGETASGKSELALYLAKKFNGEIINADSWSVYKGFDIGTAKPSVEEQTEVTHHLLDVADPGDGYSAAIFKRQVIAAIDLINSRGKIPIISGGSGLYVDSVLFDYSFLPPSEPSLRVRYNSMSLHELQALIAEYDYDIAGLDINNKRRLIRLLENKGERPSSKPMRSNTLVVGIQLSQESLKANIEQRVDKMIELGLVAEVKDLSEKYGWDIEPMKGIGYREFKNYFAGVQSLADTRSMIITDSLQLAKKQRTWFKRNNSIHWGGDRSSIVMLVTTYLNKFKR